MNISSVEGYSIYDSRGNPTVEVEVRLSNGAKGRGVAPSGASTGQFEAHELRDGPNDSMRGKGVSRAVENVNREIHEVLQGLPANNQSAVDQRMIELDGTPNKSRLGANAILATSTAVAAAAANAKGLPLYRHLGAGSTLPIPEIQMIGGGAHAHWRTDIQDWLLIANGAKSYAETLEITFRVFHAVGDLLKEQGKISGVADEGGYWPEFDSHEAVFEAVVEGIERAGYKPGLDASLALDIAASDLYDSEKQTYRLRLEDRVLDRSAWLDQLNDWMSRYPVISIEDPFADTDWEGWKSFMEQWGKQVQVVGDDLFTTNPARIRQGIDRGAANAVLIKLNQIGTVSETLEAIALTREAGWTPLVSARSGETEDAFITHLAVGTDSGQLKVGSFTRSERMVKWNEGLRIARELGSRACFPEWRQTGPG